MESLKNLFTFTKAASTPSESESKADVPIIVASTDADKTKPTKEAPAMLDLVFICEILGGFNHA